MKTFNLLTTVIPTLLAVAGAMPAEVTTSDVATLDKRGSYFYIGTEIGRKIAWKEGADACKEFPNINLGPGDNPCDRLVTDGDNNLVFKNCGVGNPELWQLDENKQPVTKLSTCTYGYQGNGQKTRHSCNMLFGILDAWVEWTCEYNL
jgi:hypothetical protein